jgi:hypothetical protein
MALLLNKQAKSTAIAVGHSGKGVKVGGIVVCVGSGRVAVAGGMVVTVGIGVVEAQATRIATEKRIQKIRRTGLRITIPPFDLGISQIICLIIL